MTMSKTDDSPDPDDLPPAVRETLDTLGSALGDLAGLDEDELHETIGLLETLGHDQAAEVLRSRRSVLKAGGAITGAALGGALVSSKATQPASAQASPAGTVGDGDEFFDGFNANFGIGGGVAVPGGRDVVTTESNTVSVDLANTETVTVGGTDYEYYIVDVPARVEHQQTYQFPTGTHDVHILVPPFVVGDITGASGTEGAVSAVRLEGGTDEIDATNYTYQSLLATGVVGAQSPKIFGLNFVGIDPTSDEDPAVAIYGCSHPSVDNCSFAGAAASQGVMAYGSTVSIEGNTDLGTSDLNIGFNVKHGGHIETKNSGVQGTCVARVGQARGGSMLIADDTAQNDDGDSGVGSGAYGQPGSGMIYESATGRFARLSTTERSWQDVTSSRSTTFGETNDAPDQIAAAARFDVDTSGSIGANAIVNGTVVDRVDETLDAGDAVFLQWPEVPPGAGYSVSVFSGSLTLAEWNELRP
jgi:hypothetical protein